MCTRTAKAAGAQDSPAPGRRRLNPRPDGHVRRASAPAGRGGRAGGALFGPESPRPVPPSVGQCGQCAARFLSPVRTRAVKRVGRRPFMSWRHDSRNCCLCAPWQCAVRRGKDQNERGMARGSDAAPPISEIAESYALGQSVCARPAVRQSARKKLDGDDCGTGERVNARNRREPPLSSSFFLLLGAR